MTEQDIEKLIKEQNKYFDSGLTLSFESRLVSLKALKRAILSNEDELCRALKEDLGKSRAEAFMCEIGLAISEINWLIKHLRGLMRKKYALTPLAQFALGKYEDIDNSPYSTYIPKQMELYKLIKHEFTMESYNRYFNSLR